MGRANRLRGGYDVDAAERFGDGPADRRHQIFQPRILTPFLLRHAATTARVTDEMRQIEDSTATMTQEVYYRYAKVLPSRPEAWTATGIQRSENSSLPYGTNAVTLNSSANENLWVQFALFAKTTAGVAAAQSGLAVQLDGHARVVGARTIEINPWSGTAYFTVGKPFEGINVASLMFAMVLSGVSGTVAFQPVTRTFPALLESPGGWSVGGDAVSTDSEALLNDVFTKTTSDRYLQAGIKVTSTGASATLQVLVVATE